ncbi:hypothetical protein BHE74_00057114 [Ensete ventricosum]|nr:hypothetical protein BHE74_00057114 [Ensete ventricosum]
MVRADDSRRLEMWCQHNVRGNDGRKETDRLYVCANPGDDAEEARGWKQAAVCLAVGGIESSRSRRWRRPKSTEIARRNRCGVDVLP